MSDTVDVWRIRPLQVGGDINVLRATLSIEELARADQLTGDLRRRFSVISRAVVRILLSRYTKIPAEELMLVRGKNGKPNVHPSQNAQNIAFNFSDSGDMALLAVAGGREVGVDIEKIHEVRRAAEIARRRFSPNAETDLAALQPSERSRVFLQNWARYEALIKARAGSLWDTPGEGNLTFSVTQSYLHEGPDFTVRDLDAGHDYVGALAVQGTGWNISVREFTD